MRRACVAYACVLALLCPLASCRHDDDFAFDNTDETQMELTNKPYSGLRRLWGVPDISAYVGRLFRMEIPKEAFSGEVTSYKIVPESGRRLPSWVAVDSRHGLVSGLPQVQDIGLHRFTVLATGSQPGSIASDTFTIEVKRISEKPHSKYGWCHKDESKVVMMILVDAAYNEIAPKTKMRALMELAAFMAIDWDEFWMEPYKSGNGLPTVLASGPGSSQRHKEYITSINFNVGCGGQLWRGHQVVVSGVREQARDGSLQHALRLPVLGWRLVAHHPELRRKRQLPVDEGSGDDYSYDGEEEMDEDDDGDEFSGFGEDHDEGFDMNTNTNHKQEELAPPPPAPGHPHRHHHGEPALTPGYSVPHTTTDLFQTEQPTPTLTSLTPFTPTSPSTVPTITTPLTTPPPPPTTTEEPSTAQETTPTLDSSNTFTTEPDKVVITPFQSPSPSNEVTPRRYANNAHSPVVITPEEPTTTNQPDTQTVIIRASNELPMTSWSEPTTSASPSPATSPAAETVAADPVTSTESSEVTTPTTMTSNTSPMTTSPTTSPSMPSSASTQSSTTLQTTPVSETSISDFTEQEYATSTDRTSTIIGRTTETVPSFVMPTNQPPTLKHHMKKMAITAGKAFRYIIPADLFTDPEEGTNLTFTMYEADNTKLGSDSWIQFLPEDREVYGLPLESHVSRWNFIVEARDSEGLSARGPLDITVQQHKGARTINHKFILQLQFNQSYTNAIDWQIRALEGIVNLFRDTDMAQLTVLEAGRKGDVYEFVWTNDTLPKDSACPMEDIMRLQKMLADESGAPSAGLMEAMRPALAVRAVRWEGAGRCGSGWAGAPPPHAFPPVPRNQVDLLTATVGHLLVHRVPEDTFFDPEDGGTRNLALSLRYSDRSELPPGHWLQFDSNNQEFYGLPGPGDVGSVNYQLIAEDSNKKSAYDSLLVEVLKAPPLKPAAEFRMTLDYPFPDLAYNAKNKRRVVEKLAALFGQTNTNNIRIASITDSPTTVIWYNTSLPMDRCPKEEIQELRDIISGDESDGKETALKDIVDHVFDKDLKVMSITIIPLGLCIEQDSKPDDSIPPAIVDGSGGARSGAPDPAIWHPNTVKEETSSRDPMITLILPLIVMLTLVVLGVLIAGLLYRRRTQRKMNVGDSEEREAFRPKGIPVIFQDELDERGDAEPAHKSPVIMREEKPPLLEWSREDQPYREEQPFREDQPYRPPPPFPAASTPPRPKPAPTYRAQKI